MDLYALKVATVVVAVILASVVVYGVGRVLRWW